MLRLKFWSRKVTMSCLFNVAGKKHCPFMEKCYRKNPIHFSEMSHPHCNHLFISFSAREV